MFLKGAEAIAFQQGSQSSNSGMWEIVPSTSTDIYYNKGDVGIGKSVAPDAALEILDAAQQQLRLTFQEDTKYADFTVDTSHNLTIDPSSTGQIKLAAVDVTIEEDLIHEGDPDTKLTFTDDDVEVFAGNLSMLKLTEAAQDVVDIGDVAGTGDVDIDFSDGQMFLQGSDGKLGVGIAPTAGLVHISKTITSAAVNERFLAVRGTFDGSGAGAAGMDIQPVHSPSATVSVAYGANYQATFAPGTGVTISNAYNFWARVATGSGGGSITNSRAIIIASPNYGTTKPTTAKGLEINNQGAAGITTVHGIHVTSQSGATNNYAAVFEGVVGVGATSPGAQLHADQPSTTAAIPVLTLDQADLSEEFINFISTIGAGNPIDTATIGTYYGKVRVAVNGTFKYMALYNS